MTTLLGGSLLVVGAGGYAIRGQVAVVCARILVAAGIICLASLWLQRTNLPLALAAELSLVALLVRKPMMEALLIPLAGVIGLLGGLAQVGGIEPSLAFAWAGLATIGLTWAASVLVHRIEQRAYLI